MTDTSAPGSAHMLRRAPPFVERTEPPERIRAEKASVLLLGRTHVEILRCCGPVAFAHEGSGGRVVARVLDDDRRENPDLPAWLRDARPEDGAEPDAPTDAETVRRLLDAEEIDIVYAPAITEDALDRRALGLAAWVAACEHGARVRWYDVTVPSQPSVFVSVPDAARREALRRRRLLGEASAHTSARRALRAFLCGDVADAEPFREPEPLSGTPDDAASVAVVVRTCDRPALLARALESLAEQTRPPDEVVVVDAGDDTPRDILDPFSNRLPVRLVAPEGRLGRSAAANAGWKACASRFVVFLDDDDTLLPEHLETLLSAACAEDALVHTGYVTVRPDGIVAAPPVSPTAHRSRLRFENMLAFMTVLFPRSAIEAAGGLDESLDCYEDWDLLLRVARRRRFVTVPAATAEYRLADTPDGSTGERPRDAWLRRIRERHGPSISDRDAVGRCLENVLRRMDGGRGPGVTGRFLFALLSHFGPGALLGRLCRRRLGLPPRASSEDRP